MDSPIRIHCAYKTIEGPYGGANNFLRALYAELGQDPAFQLVDEFPGPYAVLFMNQLNRGPGGGGNRFDLATVQVRLRNPVSPAKLVVRAVNLEHHSFRHGLRGWLPAKLRDFQVIRLINLSDHTIYQSRYQRIFFERAGARPPQANCIHNGANRAFDTGANHRLPCEGPLVLAASSFSPRPTKGHDMIARMSRIAGIVVRYSGQWPAHVNPEKVVLEGLKTHEELASIYREAHAFLHPAIKDPCPNSVLEALRSRLPVLYVDAPGSTPELVGPCGMAIDPEHPERTIAALKNGYDGLQAALNERYEHFGIVHAVEEYKKVFRRAVGEKL